MNLKESQKNKFHETWWNKLSQEFDQEYMQNIYKHLIFRRNNFAEILPSSDKVYKAFEFPFDDINVVILGQD